MGANRFITASAGKYNCQDARQPRPRARNQAPRVLPPCIPRNVRGAILPAMAAAHARSPALHGGDGARISPRPRRRTAMRVVPSPVDMQDFADRLRGNDRAELEPLPWVDLYRWHGKPAPQREWAIKDLVPLRQTGLFSGEGGTGKSIIELTKNVAHVLG